MNKVLAVIDPEDDVIHIGRESTRIARVTLTFDEARELREQLAALLLTFDTPRVSR